MMTINYYIHCLLLLLDVCAPNKYCCLVVGCWWLATTDVDDGFCLLRSTHLNTMIVEASAPLASSNDQYVRHQKSRSLAPLLVG
jgi:hypothetical protein